MSRPQAPDASDAAADELLDAPASEPGRAVAVDLASLPIVGLTRRRMALMVGALLAVWILITFARQVAEASESVTRAEDIATGNAVIRLEVAAMERELEAIGRQRFIEQQARGYGVGNSHETPFALAPDAPPLAADAPGSAAVRVGADIEDVSPFERWLTVLFGPSG